VIFADGPLRERHDELMLSIDRATRYRPLT
jgi:hypothetical protein